MHDASFKNHVLTFKASSSSEPVFIAARTPTSADQCKHDGYTQYGIFRNQGDCVANTTPNQKRPHLDQDNRRCSRGGPCLRSAHVSVRSST